MATWRNSPKLSNTERLLVHDGLYEEVAPGRVVEADLAGAPALRASQLAPYVPRGHVTVTYSACWIYTGWWPRGRMREVFAAHPQRTKPPAVYRHTVPEQFTRRIGGLTVTTPARTAIDLLLLEPWDEAVEGLLQLYGAHVTCAELVAQANMESRRKRLPMVRELLAQFVQYIEWRDALVTDAVRAAGTAGSLTYEPAADRPS
ncbi:MAG: hypothetical protein ACTHW1_07835 [Ancrocorticia sp.]|uniref:hypothetical protein n=1 Tax=Ancrocorticia sp. TaxID=2593684 RepID=UPI003F90CB44